MIRFEIKPEVVEWLVQEWVREPEMAQELIEGLMGMMIAYGCISVNDNDRLKQAAPALLAAIVHIAKPQIFKGSKWIAIFSNEPDEPTLWISYGDEFTPDEKQRCEQYAEKVAALINNAKGSDN